MCIEKEDYKLEKITSDFSNYKNGETKADVELNFCTLIPKDENDATHIVRLELNIKNETDFVFLAATMTGKFTMSADFLMKSYDDKMQYLKNNCFEKVYARFISSIESLQENNTIPSLVLPKFEDFNIID